MTVNAHKNQKAIVIVSHGSRSPQTKLEIRRLVARIQKIRSHDIVDFAFLEIESPSIPEGIYHAIDQGAKHVLILLNFLNSGRHVNIDIPAIVQDAKKKFPSVNFKISKPVGQHPKIVKLFEDLIKAN